MKRHISFLTIFIYSLIVLGQTNNKPTYDLQECINLALENNLDLKTASLNRETANVNFKQSKNALLPTLNGNYNIGKTDGRSIDPFTNSYINEQLTFSNAGLQIDAVVFNGFRLINNWKQKKYNLLASEMAKEEARQNLILEVTLTYLQVVNNQDLYDLAKNRLENTRKQLERLKTLYDEQIGNPSEYHDLLGLKANDEASILNTKNNLDRSKLDLMQLLNTKDNFDVSPMDVPFNIEAYDDTLENVYALALQNLATVKVGEYRLKAAEKGVSVAKSQYTPEISLFANLGTNYSSSARFYNEGAKSIVQTGDFVTINGQDFPVLTEQSEFTPEKISYQDQFKNNSNKAIGLAVNIPLFNGFRAKNNVALEKIKKEEASIELEQTKLQLRTIIEKAYNDMLAAYDGFEILKEQVTAYNESLRINEIRFNNGVSSSVDYIISKNNADNAQINLNNLKYEYVLRVKLLEYYKGNI